MFEAQKKISAMCLLYKIHHIADHSLHEYLQSFVAACNIRDSAALSELALVIPHAAELINSYGRLCLSLFACRTCCCCYASVELALVVAPCALLRVL